MKPMPVTTWAATREGSAWRPTTAKAPEMDVPFEQQLFPRKLLEELGRFTDETVVFSAGENHLGFKIGDRNVVSRIVELRFPQYERVIVRDNPNRVRIGREELLASLRRVSLMAHEKARGVRFKLDALGELTLVSIGYDRGSAEETLMVAYQGESLDIALNAAYMMDVLKILDVEQVELQLRDSGTQCVVVPVDDDQRLEEYIYVLMPMRI